MEDNKSNFEQAYALQKKRSEEKLQYAMKWMANKSPVFVAFGIAIFWIFYGMVEIVDAQLSLKQRIILSIITAVLAVVYCGLLSRRGFKSAKESDKYTKADDKYKDAQNRGITKKKQITRYAEEVAENNLKELRKTNLELNGLRYEMIFDDKGELRKEVVNYKENKYHSKKNKLGYTRKQRRVIKKCIAMTVVLPDIFGTISNKFFGLKKEQTQKSYERKSDALNFLIRVALSFATVAVMFKFLGISLGSAIYAFMQIVLWTSSAISQRMKNFSFVMDVLLPQIEDKTLIINGYLDLPDEEKLKYEDEYYLKEEIKEENKDGKVQGLRIRPIQRNEKPVLSTTNAK